MFTCDIEALYPCIQVWPGVGLCLFDVVERAIRRFYSLEQDLVEFLVRLLHLVLSTQLTQYGGSFFEVTWGLSTGLQQVSWPICIWLCWTFTCGRVQWVLSSVSSSTLMTVFGVLDSRNISVHELQRLLNGWNACSPLPFLDLALEKRVLDARKRKFGVKFSAIRKKLNIYSYVPGDSDHHPCMMQRTIRGELTRLLRTNSSVDSFEQEVKFFRLEWTRRGHDGKEFDRIAKNYPWLAKKTLVGGPKKIKSKPFVYKIQHSRSLRFLPFRRIVKQACDSCTEILGS